MQVMGIFPYCLKYCKTGPYQPKDFWGQSNLFLKISLTIKNIEFKLNQSRPTGNRKILASHNNNKGNIQISHYNSLSCAVHISCNNMRLWTMCWGCRGLKLTTLVIQVNPTGLQLPKSAAAILVNLCKYMYLYPGLFNRPNINTVKYHKLINLVRMNWMV